MRVLIVEDHPDTVELIRAILKECRWEMQDCDTIEDAFRIKERFEPNVILLDLALKDSSRQETLDAITRLSDRAIIVLTGACDPQTISAAFKNGADDCLSKDSFTDRRAFVQTIRGAWDHFSRRNSLAKVNQRDVSAQITKAEKELLGYMPTMRQSVERLEQAVFFAEDSMVAKLAVVVDKVTEMSSQAKMRTWVTILVLLLNMIITVVGAFTHTNPKQLEMPGEMQEHK